MKTLYFDCFSGIAGDMAVGALLDLGAEFSTVQRGLARLGVAGLTVSAAAVTRSHIAATHFIVHAPHEDAHRTFGDIRSMIQGADLNQRVSELSIEIFRRIAQAEGTIHRIDPEEVTFHEVGAVDSIADVVGFALALDALDVEALNVRASALPWSAGAVQTAHGELPLPAPATLALLKGFEMYSVDPMGELITPTGAGILCATAGRTTGPGVMTIEATGYGAGTRDVEGRPNVVRAILGDDAAADGLLISQVVLLETNLDDLDPRILATVTETLMEAGALDVWVTPIQMKKGRPAFQLSVLARADAAQSTAAAMMVHTTSLGVRFRALERFELPREIETLETRFGPVSFKVAGGRARPEFDECKAIAARSSLSVHEVLLAVQEDWNTRG